MYRPRFVSASILISLAAITVGSGCGGGNATHRALKEGWYTYGDARTVDPITVPVTELEAWSGDEGSSRAGSAKSVRRRMLDSDAR